jgi:hypothetical protein
MHANKRKYEIIGKLRQLTRGSCTCPHALDSRHDHKLKSAKRKKKKQERKKFDCPTRGSCARPHAFDSRRTRKSTFDAVTRVLRETAHGLASARSAHRVKIKFHKLIFRESDNFVPQIIARFSRDGFLALSFNISPFGCLTAPGPLSYVSKPSIWVS